MVLKFLNVISSNTLIKSIYIYIQNEKMMRYWTLGTCMGYLWKGYICKEFKFFWGTLASLKYYSTVATVHESWLFILLDQLNVEDWGEHRLAEASLCAIRFFSFNLNCYIIRLCRWAKIAGRGMSLSIIWDHHWNFYRRGRGLLLSVVRTEWKIVGDVRFRNQTYLKSLNGI